MTDYPRRPRSEPAAPVDGVGMFCANCQAPLPPDAEFCNKCGARRLTRDTSPTQVLPVTRPVSETVVEEEIRDEPRLVRAPPPTNWWPLAALGVLGILILLLVLFLALDDDDDDVVDTVTTTTLPLATVPTTSPVVVPAPATQPPQTILVPVQPAPTTAQATTAPPTTASTTTSTTTTTTAPVPGL